jgi:RNA polymerase sigma-70 factor (family 1)
MLPYNSYSDQELMVLLKQNDDKAFTEIYNRYWEKLFSVAGNKLSNLELAEELVQNIFLDLWNRREQIEITVALNFYLASAMKYKVIDARLKRSREANYQKYSLKHFSEEDRSTEQYLSFKELKNQLMMLVAQLPEKCQLVYKLSKEDGFSQKEIAWKLHLSEKTVESHLSRASKSLRTSLSKILFFIS